MCKWVKRACERHLHDLVRQQDEQFPFQFDEARASHACRFIEGLPHVTDDFKHRASRHERIKLEPWQRFIVCCVFGWILKNTRTYRFRIVYVCVPRKNAKSTLGAGIGLYKVAAENEQGAQVFSGATTEKQAWEVFRPARQMAELTPDLCRAYGITLNAKSIVVSKTGSRFEPVIGKPGDGASPHCAIVDEYHEHATSDMYDTMLTGMGAKQNPLLLVITTAGSDRSSPCYGLQQTVQSILDGKITNERLFGIIYGIDDNDDWTSPAILRKANPNFDVSVDSSFLLEQQADAVQNASRQNTFKTKHLNEWVNVGTAWMNMARWDACTDPTIRLADFDKAPCMIGLDLASRIDFTAKMLLFRRTIADQPHYFAFGTYYQNEAQVTNVRNMHYSTWEKEKRLRVTPGNVTDYMAVAEDVLADVGRFYVREIPHDPYHAMGLIQFVTARPEWDQQCQFVEVRQTAKMMSPAMKELEALVYSKRFHHDGDPVLGWMMSNVICQRDAMDNIFPRKEREENKIDGVIALLVALKRWMDAPPEITDGRIEFWG